MNQKEKFHSITALKGIFILVIAFHNAMLITPLFDRIPGTAFITVFGGALGNSMFFILSGFLISYSYRARIMSRSLSFKEYLSGRVKKLYPMYLATNIIALIIAILQYGMSAINLKKIVFTFMLQNGGGLGNENPYNSPTWFVSTLFVCYVAYFVLAHYSRSIKHYHYGLTFSIILGYTLMNTALQIPFCYPANGIGLMNFGIGCVLAEVYPLISHKVHRWLRPVSFITVCLLLFLFLRYGTEIICGDINTAFAFVVNPLIFYLAIADGLCSGILRLKPFVCLGQISMFVFYWHLVIYNGFRLVLKCMFPGVPFEEKQFLIYFAIMIIWSALTHIFVQRKKIGQKTLSCR